MESTQGQRIPVIGLQQGAGKQQLLFLSLSLRGRDRLDMVIASHRGSGTHKHPTQNYETNVLRFQEYGILHTQHYDRLATDPSCY
jgi:hypothetical protein